MWQSRNSSNQCPPRTHTHAPTYTCYTHTHPQHRCSPAYKDLWNNHCKPPRTAARPIDQLVDAAVASSLNFKIITTQRRPERDPETFDSTSHLPSVAILLLCCSHFVSLPFSTLLRFSWGCQMARVKPPPPPPRPIICDRLDDRQIDGQTRRQTERQKEGR